MRSRRTTALLVASTALLCLLLRPGAAWAQAAVLPGAKRPELPSFPGEKGEKEKPGPLELPKLPPPALPHALSAGLRVFVRAFRFEGSTVFSDAELTKVVQPWTGMQITSEDLLRARDAITRHYVQHGYLTSGAVIPDQSVESGVVRVQIVEGRLASIEVRGTHRFRPGYFRTRLRRAGRAPVSVVRLERELEIFQRDPRVRRVHARLEPGVRRGESVLELTVEENRFYGLSMRFSNESSPAVGGYTGTTEATLSNLTGWGDRWWAEGQFADGLTDAQGSVSIPLPPFDTELEGHFQYSEDRVVETPFNVLDIQNESRSYGITLRQPLLRSERQELALGVTGEYRTSRTKLLGQCFAFVSGTGDCDSKASVVRTFADWALSTRNDVVALRSTLSVGVGALGATRRSGDLPDGRFLAWLGQAQWVHRLPDKLRQSQLLLRVDTQLSNDPLLGIEKFAVGGMRTVRGYRENQLVRDDGVVASGELRVPVWRDPRGRPLVELAPFIDYGRSWNYGESSSADTLWSTGVGLRVSPWEWLHGELYWGHPFEKVPDEGGDLQDEGIHFAVTLVPL